MAAPPILTTHSAVTPAFVARLPKVELHVHLEGSLTPDTVLRFARRNGLGLPANTAEELRAHYTFTSLSDFIRVYLMCAGTLRTPLDFAEATTEFLAFQATQNVRYVEAFVAPKLHVANGADVDAILNMIVDAAAESYPQTGVRLGLIVDVGRLYGADLSVPLARAAVRHQNRGVVGIGLGGDEASGPPSLWRESFALARDGGLHLTSHGGEIGGPEYVWSAIRDLGVERIGHAVAAVRDPALIRHLVEQRIGLELCPQSNLRIGVVSSLQEHPFGVFREAGALVTVNTDDPAIFANPLNDEYLAVAQAFALSPHDLCQLSLNAVDASFLATPDKALLRGEMISDMNAALASIGWPPLPLSA